MMERSDALIRLKESIKSRNTLAAPSVDTLEPVIRSGDQFMFRDPLGAGLPDDERETIERRLERRMYVGNVVVEWGYDVVKEKGEYFRRWLLDNELDIHESQPEGVRYRGTYGVFSSSEKGTGQYRTVWVFESMEAFEAMSGALGSDDSRFARLLSEFNDFRDTRIGAGSSQQICLLAAGAKRFF